MLPQAYPPTITMPIRQELRAHGIRELKTPQEVDQALASKPLLILINSVCGCAARAARPALYEIQQRNPTMNLASVFAGVDREATKYVRETLKHDNPTSPSFLHITEDQVKYLPRSEIEGSDEAEIADKLEQLAHEQQ